FRRVLFRSPADVGTAATASVGTVPSGAIAVAAVPMSAGVVAATVRWAPVPRPWAATGQSVASFGSTWQSVGSTVGATVAAGPVVVVVDVDVVVVDDVGAAGPVAPASAGPAFCRPQRP